MCTVDVTGFLHQHITGKLHNPLCALFRIETETVTHVMQCHNNTATKTRNLAARTFEDNLVNASTHTNIITILVQSLAEQSPIDKLTANNAYITTAATEQEAIGWNIVKYGILSKVWQAAQYKCAADHGTNLGCQQVHQWTRTLHGNLWDYINTV